MKFVFSFSIGLALCLACPGADQQKPVPYAAPPNGLTVVDQAHTWKALCKKTKPTFTWGEHDMMWIEGKGDQPRIRLNRAYKSGDGMQIYRKAPNYGRIGARSGDFTETIPKWVPEKPANKVGAGDYITQIAHCPKRGKVHEIGWQDPLTRGMGRWVEERRLYLFCHPTKGWVFLGEGPGEGSGRTGARVSHSFSTQRKVDFDTSNDAPCKIMFLEEDSDYELEGEVVGAKAPRENVTLNRRWLLDGLVHELKPQSKHPFVAVRAGDTLDRIVHRIATWETNWKFAGKEERADILAYIKNQIVAINPKRDLTEVKKGDEIFVLKYYDLSAIRKKHRRRK